MVLYRRYRGISSGWVSADYRLASVFGTLTYYKILTKHNYKHAVNPVVGFARANLLKVTCLQNHSVKHTPKGPRSCRNIVEVMLFPVTLSLPKFSMWTLKNKCKSNFWYQLQSFKSPSLWYTLCNEQCSTTEMCLEKPL